MASFFNIVAKFKDEASAGLNSLQNKVSNISQILSAAFVIEGITSAVSAITDLTAAAIDSADAIGKAAQQYGITTESLSALSYAAELSDVSFEQLTTGLSKLTKSMVAAGDPASTAAEAFESLGVKTTDVNGKLRKTDDVLTDIAESFKNAADGPEKTAVAMELFGKSGAQLIPLLNEGKDGLAALKAEAEDLGIVIGENTAARAEEFNDTLTRMHAAGKGVFLQFAEKILPALQGISSAFVQSAKDGGTLNAIVNALAFSFKFLVSTGYLVSSLFQGIGKTLGAVGAAIVALIHGDFAGAKQIMSDLKSDFGDLSLALADNIEATWKETAAVEENNQAQEKTTKTVINFTGQKHKQAEASERAAAALEKENANLERQVKSFIDPAGETYRKRIEEIQKARERGLITAEEYAAAEVKASEDYDKTTEAYKKQQTQLELRKKLTEESLTPLEKLVAKQKEYKAALDAGTINQTVFDKLNEGVNKEIAELSKKKNMLTEFSLQAARNIQDILGQGLTDVMEGHFNGILEKFRSMINAMVAEVLASKLANWLFGDFTKTGKIGGFAGGLFGARASGGPVRAGEPYIVGELRPEVFVPTTDGHIYPSVGAGNAALGGSGQSITNHLTIQALDSQSVLEAISKIDRELTAMTAAGGRKYNIGFA